MFGGKASPRDQTRFEPAQLGIHRLFEATTDAIILADEQGKVLLWNPSAARLFGYDEREAIGMNIDRLVPPELLDQHRAGMERYRRTGRGQLIEAGKPIEVPAIRKSGSRFWVDLSLSAVQHEGRRYALSIVRDATDRIRLQEQNALDAKRLRDANESLETFARVVSHDLKEPVRAIVAYLEMIKSEPDPAQRDALIERASAAQANLVRLLDGLLEWSRAAMTPLETRPLLLHDVLADPGCSVQWENLLRERNATLDVQQDVPPILATKDLVCRVFGNLITNAIRHNPRADPRVRIHGKTTAEGAVEIRVEDNGPGFPPHVLERFAQSPAQPRTIKSGFGLTITQRALERLEGTMRIENKPGSAGSVVRVVLPAPRPRKPKSLTLEERVKELI